jgi:rubrerythrin
MHWLKEIRKKEKEKEKEMTVADDTNNQQQLIHCPNCGNSITVDDSGELYSYRRKHVRRG